MAAAIAGLAPKDGPALQAAAASTWTPSPTALGHPDGFGDATKAALNGVGPEGPGRRADRRPRLARAGDGVKEPEMPDQPDLPDLPERA